MTTKTADVMIPPSLRYIKVSNSGFCGNYEIYKSSTENHEIETMLVLRMSYEVTNSECQNMTSQGILHKS